MSDAVEPELRSVGVEVTHGSTNNLFQVATLVRAATALGATVEVVFLDAALSKLRRDRLNLPEWSVVYRAVEPELTQRLAAADFTDMESFLRDAKEHGDGVHFWASSTSLAAAKLSLADLTPLLDGSRTEPEIKELLGGVEAVLRF